MDKEKLSDAQELGRRVKAARVYRDVTQTDLGKALGHRRETVGRWENGEIDRDYKRESLLRAAVKVTGMPKEFFSIDFKQLPEMVKAWRQAGGGGVGALGPEPSLPPFGREDEEDETPDQGVGEA